jgi:hypothetical protein
MLKWHYRTHNAVFILSITCTQLSMSLCLQISTSVRVYHDTMCLNTTNCITMHYVFNTAVAPWRWQSTAETCRRGMTQCICMRKLLVLWVNESSCYNLVTNDDELGRGVGQKHSPFTNRDVNSRYKAGLLISGPRRVQSFLISISMSGKNEDNPPTAVSLGQKFSRT